VLRISRSHLVLADFPKGNLTSPLDSTPTAPPMVCSADLGVPSVYGGYSTMLNFWHGIGVSPCLWLRILAVAVGVASGWTLSRGFARK
jgi:hypothetical protein